tara:strand:- start:378 stop:617 length:240 start_codon:yes stop_codon:yes gene_type:complete
VTEADIKKFFNNINNLSLSKSQKKRMLRLFQVRGSNKKNKVMSYKEFKNLLSIKKGKITSLVLGPKWNRLVFIDIDLEI